MLEDWGALDISFVSDLPVFIDPFLLFSSDKDEYCRLSPFGRRRRPIAGPPPAGFLAPMPQMPQLFHFLGTRTDTQVGHPEVAAPELH